MKFVYALLILATCPQVVDADTQMTGRYALPLSKVNIEHCRREALLLHSGVIEKQRIVHRHEDFWVRFEIRTSEGAEWLALCDLASGSIIREQKLVDDGS